MTATGRRTVRDRDLSLAQAFAAFARELTPKLLTLHLLAWLGYRVQVALGDPLNAPTWADLAIVAAILAVHPFAEWIIHVFILHHRPRTVTVLGKPLRWDYHAARKHRLHHRDPWDIRHVLIPLPILAFGLSLNGSVALAVLPTPGLAGTFAATIAALVLYYEWIHFLVHTSYRPRGALYRRQWRLHRLHHFKNERYWLGVTRHFGDRALGTFADPESVETSKTARTLFE